MDGTLQELMAGKLGGEKSAKKSAKLHMNVHKMDDGKFYIEHHMRGGQEPEESKQYAAADIKELHDHMDKHFGPPPESVGPKD